MNIEKMTTTMQQALGQAQQIAMVLLEIYIVIYK